MVTVIDDGWLVLTDGTDTFKVFFQQALVMILFDPTIEHNPGSHYGFNLVEYIIIKVSGILFNSTTKYENFMLYMRNWQGTNPFTLSIYKDTSSNKLKLDGENTDFSVLIPSSGIQGGSKIAPEDGEVYRIETITFEQAGASS